tara:strand:- start:470 stop:649 length:180 start_codon:yes stop_codon:yes gene_type:complete
MTDTFIQKAITIHGDKYDYSKVNYTTARGCVIINFAAAFMNDLVSSASSLASNMNILYI